MKKVLLNLHQPLNQIYLEPSQKVAQSFPGSDKALRLAMQRVAGRKVECVMEGVKLWAHAAAQPAPLQAVVGIPIDTSLLPSVLPEDQDDCRSGVLFSNIPYVRGSRELMGVKRSKVTPHKKHIRNGPKALKPVPVIVRCTVCGKVKLPHFSCYSGIQKSPGEE